MSNNFFYLQKENLNDGWKYNLLIDDYPCHSKTINEKASQRKQPFDCPVFVLKFQYYTDDITLMCGGCALHACARAIVHFWLLVMRCMLIVCGWLFLERCILSKHEALTVPMLIWCWAGFANCETTLIHHRVKVSCSFDCIVLPHKFWRKNYKPKPSNWSIRPGRNIWLCINHPVTGRCSFDSIKFQKANPCSLMPTNTRLNVISIGLPE